MKLHQNTVLVLNKNWQAVSTTTPANAFTQLVSGNANGLSIHSENGMTLLKWVDWIKQPLTESDHTVSTPSQKIKVPTVIVLTNYGKLRHQRLKFGFKGLWERDGGRCQYTGRKLTPEEANIDHIVPQSRGGPTSWENCVLSAKTVNSRKAAKTPKEAGLRLIAKPEKPKAVPATFLIKNTHQIADWNHFLPA